MNLRKSSRKKLKVMSAQAFEYHRNAKYLTPKALIGVFTVNPSSKWYTVMTKGYIDRKIETIEGKRYITAQRRKYPTLLALIREMKKIITEKENRDDINDSKMDNKPAS